MNSILNAIASIHYGKSPLEVIDIYGMYPIIGTGGEYGRASKALFSVGIVVPRKGSLGKPRLLEKPFWCADTTYAVIPNNQIDVRWLYYNLLHFDLTRLNEATRVPSISRDWLAKLSFFDPGYDVQKKIAKILSTIDRTIAKTEALIEKYQQIKAGLMHDLFTRGIGADGKLRSPREEAPELYQETAIGWIPKDWEVKQCSDLCTRICVGIVIQPTQYYVEEGTPAFRSANIREYGIDPNNFVYISPHSNNLLLKSQVKAGDILSVRTGYPGTSAIVPKEFDGSNCVDILISTPGNQISSEYLCNWINSSFGKEQVLRQQGGMAQQHFNVGEMKQLLVALPNISEQLSIKDKLKMNVDKLRAEQNILAKLQKQKSGLMHDLLTGKVSVDVDPAP
jgi:type I restriction enzyme, S subunit